MTVSVESAISGPFTPNGVTTSFPFTFKAGSATEVGVVDQDGTALSTALYSVSLDDDEGGSVLFSVAPALADYGELYIVSTVALTQTADFDNAGTSFNPAALTRALDRAAVRDLKQQLEIDRTFKVPFGEDGPTFPSAAERANLYPVFDADGNLSTSAGTGADAGMRTDLASTATGKGAALVGMLQEGDDAVADDAQAAIRRAGFYPEQFGAVGDGTTDDTAAIQACIDAAANWSSAAKANRVILTKVYKTTATTLKRPYVSIEGVGMGRCGLLPTMSSGPAIDCDSVANTSGSYLDTFSNFRIDGTNCTGTAYAIRLRGQKHTRLNRVGFWNYLGTSEHAVQVLDLGYAITFDQCYWLQNRRHEKLETSSPATVFPTTITHLGCTFEATNSGAAWTHEAISITDASGITYDLNCIFQLNDQKYLFQVTNGATPTTSSLHRWKGSYFEDNGGGQVGAQTWRLVGVAANPLTRCIIEGNKIHGTAPDGGHIYAEYTTDLSVRDNSVASDHTWVVDGGNNISWDIDARSVGVCGLQTTFYNTTTFAFTDAGVVTESSGVIGVSIVKQATGRWDITLDRAILSTAAVVHVAAFDAGGDALAASGFFSTTTLLQVRVNAIGTTTAATPSRVMVQFIAEIGPLP